ncbi:MAG: hypothetical protein JSV43_08750 [Methanobacteriota archaeon]|nr:MAG: hypothetical protein JSV43_08750 [Euryarchaeota archaeon]
MGKINVIEEDLKAGLKSFFRSHGYRAYAEVRMINRWVDLVAVKGDEVVAVEIKLSNWKEALRQAVAYQLGADYSFVAMLFKHACHAYRNRYWFQKEGVGLIAVRPHHKDIRVLLEPERSTRMMPMVRDNLFVFLELSGEKMLVPKSCRNLSKRETNLSFEGADEYRRSNRWRL